ncbi:MAG TPA: LytTR family DNA-binding domain-containing protein [Cyclobacteriaceae bacterium]|nr:LytTR family DNA-binding domain-containing protein [Cyclobacteriaceae bacterium]
MSSNKELKIRAILIDDEKVVRSALRETLQHHVSFVEIIAEAANIPEAVREIHKHKPDLLFLDINMPGYSGLQILEFFNQQEISFDIIFVTAYNEYTLQAIKISAFDYLLKPVNIVELVQTMERYRQQNHSHKLAERLALLRENFSREELQRIAISSQSGIEFIAIDDIILLEAAGTYTTIILNDSDKIVSSKPLGEFEALLKGVSKFFRPHRSHIINLNYVKKVSFKEGDIIIMKNGYEIQLSRYRKKDFEDIIKDFRI